MRQDKSVAISTAAPTTTTIPEKRSTDQTPLPSEAVAKRAAATSGKSAEKIEPLDVNRKYQSVDAKTGQRGEIKTVAEQVAMVETKRAAEQIVKQKTETGQAEQVVANALGGPSDVAKNPNTADQKPAPQEAQETTAPKGPVIGEASLDATFGKSISETGIIAKLMPKHGDQFDVAILGGTAADAQDGVVIGGSPILSYGEGAVSTDESLSLSVAQCITPSGSACTPNLKDAGLKSGDVLYTNKSLSRTTANGAPELIQLGFVADKDLTKADAVFHKIIWENGALKSVGVKEAGFGAESAFTTGLGTKEGGLVLLGSAAADNKGTKNVLVYAEDAAGEKLCNASTSVIFSKDSANNFYLEEPIAIREDGPGQIIVVALREDHEKPYPYDRKLVWYRIKPNPECARDHEFGTNGAIVTELPTDITEISAAAFDNAGRLVVLARYENALDLQTIERSAVIRYLPNGQLDNSFASTTAANFSPGVFLTAMTIDGANNIIVGGTTETQEITDQYFIGNYGKNSLNIKGHSYDLDFFVARITPTGQLDTKFAPLGKGYVTINFPGSFFDTVTALALDSKGRIIVTGSISYHKVINKPGPNGMSDTALAYDNGVGIVRLEAKVPSADGTTKPGDVTGGDSRQDDRVKTVTVKRNIPHAEKRNLKTVIADQRTLKKADRIAKHHEKKGGDATASDASGDRAVAGKAAEEKDARLLSLRGVVGHDLKKDKREKAEGQDIKDEKEKKEKEKSKEESVAKEKKEKCWQPSSTGTGIIPVLDPGCRCWKVTQKSDSYATHMDADCKEGKKIASETTPEASAWPVVAETVSEETVASSEEEKEKCWMPSILPAFPDIIVIPDQECRCWRVIKSDGFPAIVLDAECKLGKKVMAGKKPESTEWPIPEDTVTETTIVSGDTSATDTKDTGAKKGKCWSPSTPDGGKTILSTVDPKCQCWSLKKVPSGLMTPELDVDCKKGKKITALESPLTTAWTEEALATADDASGVASSAETGAAGPTIAQLVSTVPADVATDADTATGEVEIASYEAPTTPLPADAVYVTPTSATTAADAENARELQGKTSSTAAPSSREAPASGGGGASGGCSLIR